MLASLDPLGLPLVVDIVAGNVADDPLYVPSYHRAKEVLRREGTLVVGDSKMSAIGTRGEIVGGQDYYLTPLAWLKDEPELLAQLLKAWRAEEQEATHIFLPEAFRPMAAPRTQPGRLLMGLKSADLRPISSRARLSSGKNGSWSFEPTVTPKRCNRACISAWTKPKPP